MLELLRTIFSPLCHQLQDKTFYLDGRYLPLCIRCTGIYCGFLVALIYQLCLKTRKGVRLPPLKISMIFAVVLLLIILDLAITNGLKYLYKFESGLIVGAIIAIFLLPLGNRFLIRTRADHSIIKSARYAAVLIIAVICYGILSGCLSQKIKFWFLLCTSAMGVLILYVFLAATVIARITRR